MPIRNRAVIISICLILPLISTGCSLIPAGGRSDLAPSLSFKEVSGGPVAFQSGQPVPTFDREPRPRIDLNGTWRFDSERLDTSLSLTNRNAAMAGIKREMGSHADPSRDDSGWAQIDVPGTFNPPPDRATSGGYYRRDFLVPTTWDGKFSTLKFGAVRYIADVWLNGHYLGYHEGGDTPFALDATTALNPGAFNTVVVRVDNPPWGTRDDIVPWGLADWWNYGGIVGDVWIEATPALSVVRADITPHLDGADVSIVVQHRGVESVAASIDVRMWPTQVSSKNLLNPDARSLVPSDAETILIHHIDLSILGGDSVTRVPAPFSMRDPDLWTPSLPALYVLEVTVNADGNPIDVLYSTFGLRQVKVDSTGPRVLLNGSPTVFNGVALHEERQQPVRDDGTPVGGPLTSPKEIQSILMRVVDIHADLIRVDHHPPNQFLPVLTDRLGIALWEEIPLYHFTPQTFSIAMDRGIPQQMLAEMDLRDFNRPSVLFHGFTNESGGGQPRRAALSTLHALDHRLDGSRLTGQAAYGGDTGDPTSADLDVAGYTFYYGVLYGGRLSGVAIQSALSQVHHAYPHKPVMILEFGHWADTKRAQAQQLQVFDTYYPQLSADFGSQPGGFVAAAVWWTLDDYWTQRPGITVETFGLYRPDGSLRPAGVSASRAFALTAPAAPPPSVRSRGGVALPIQTTERHALFLPYLAYGFLVPAIALIAIIAVLSWVRRRAW